MTQHLVIFFQSGRGLPAIVRELLSHLVSWFYCVTCTAAACIMRTLQIASKYNPGDYDYACEVQEIFEQISSMFYNKMPNSYEEIKLAENNDRQKDSL